MSSLGLLSLEAGKEGLKVMLWVSGIRRCFAHPLFTKSAAPVHATKR